MAEPLVFYARGGLQPEPLKGLKRADRITVAIKDERNAVLGYWVKDANGRPTEKLGIILVERDPTTVLPAERQVIVDLEDLQHDKVWRRSIGLLRSRDVLSVRWSPGGNTVSLGVRMGEELFASLMLWPRTKAKDALHSAACF